MSSPLLNFSICSSSPLTFPSLSSLASPSSSKALTALMFFAFAPVSAFSTAKSIFNWFSSDSWVALAVAFSVCKSSIFFFRSALSPADAFRVSNCLSRSPTCVFSPSTSVCKFLISVEAVPFAFSMSSPLIFITESACSLVSPKSSNCFLVISIPSFQIRFYTGLLPHD